MLLYLLAAIGAFVIMAIVWGIFHLRNSQKVAYEAIEKVRLDQITNLRNECQATFQSAFNETLAIDDLETSARVLSSRLDNVDSLKKAFARPDFYWHFVLPVGAYLGELLRVHAKAEWKNSDEGGLEMSIVAGEGVATTFPFDKVMKQVTVGDKGDVYAYLMASMQLDRTVAELVPTET